jgi:hypothetical protein
MPYYIKRKDSDIEYDGLNYDTEAEALYALNNSAFEDMQHDLLEIYTYSDFIDELNNYEIVERPEEVKLKEDGCLAYSDVDRLSLTPSEEKEKIIQIITTKSGYIYALSNKGRVFYAQNSKWHLEAGAELPE